MPITDPARLAHVMDLLLDAVCVVDPQGRFLYVSAAFERILGYTPDEVLGRPMIELVHPDDRARTLGAVDEIVAHRHKPNFENRYLHKDGRVVHIMWTARWSEADQVRVAVARDVTEKKRAEAMQAALFAISEAAHAAETLPELFKGIHGIIGSLLSAGNFFVALYNEASAQLSFPYHVDEHCAAPASGPLDNNSLSAALIRSGRAMRVVREAGSASTEVDAGPSPLDWLGVPLFGQKGIIGALVVKRYTEAKQGPNYSDQDIELLQFVSTQVAATIERKQMETWLQHMARHDPLTGLPNRELFNDRFHAALSRARRDHTRLALLYIDLDGFKQVNDQQGHATGDLLLQALAHSLQRCVRESDTVGRIGGDEFLVLLNNIALPLHGERLAEKIRLAVNTPVALAGLPPLQLSPSIGIALYPEHGNEAGGLMRCADNAMYRAKKAGGNRWQLATDPDSAGSA